MKNVLVMNLGSRDLQIKEDNFVKMKELFQNDEEMLSMLIDGSTVDRNFKAFTKKLLDYYPTGMEYVDFPIIKSIIEKVGKELQEEKLQKIILILTDQRDDKFNKKDTIYLGEIIKKIYSEKDLKRISNDLEIVNFCIKSNPSDYDEVGKFYQAELNKEYNLNKIFLNITGGTPAMSFGLLYNISLNASGKVVPFYNKQNTDIALKLNVSENFKKANDKNQINEFILKNDYMAAKILLEKYHKKYQVSDKKYETALNMIKAAHARIQFDFENALVYIENAENYDSGSRDICDDFIYSIKDLRNKENIYLLNELKNNAIYEYENGAYTDFLGRIFRMQENIYELILLKRNILRINENGNLKFNKDELDSLGIKARKIDIPYMSEILELILKIENEEYDLFDYSKRLTKIKTLRNESILAHGYKGVSKEAIDREFVNSKEFLDNLILKYKKIFNIEIEDDNFYYKDGEFNRHLRQLIEEI